jgi:arylsulfatase
MLAAARWILLIAVVVVPAGCKQPEVGRLAEGATRPNVIFVLLDALRADRLGVYGNEAGLTPNLDAMAAEGVVFDMTIAQCPWTQPSVASLFCAYHPGVHKVLDYRLAFRSTHQGQSKVSVFDEVFLTLSEAMKRGGYETAAFSSNPFIVPAFGFGQGFDHFDERFADNTTPGNVINDAFFEWVEARTSDKPFFAYLHYMDAHGPYEIGGEHLEPLLEQLEKQVGKHVLTEKETERLGYLRRMPKFPPPADPARHEKLWHFREYWVARYDACVSALDGHMGALRKRLEEDGLWENTLIIVTADHGEALCEHSLWEHGFSVHHNQLRVPLFFRWPGVLAAGQRVPHMSRLIDVMPTLLDQLRLPPSEGVQGASLVPYLQPGASADRRMAFAEGVKIGTEQKALYQGVMKLHCVMSNPPRFQVFNIAVDPDEQRDLAKAPGVPLVEMRKTLMGIIAENAEILPVEQRQVPISDAQRRRLESLGYAGEGHDEEDEPPPPETQPGGTGEDE